MAHSLTVRDQIAALPTPVVIATLRRLGGPDALLSSKAAAAEWLAEQVHAGLISLDSIRVAPPVDTAATAAAAAVAARAETLALDSAAATRALSERVKGLDAGLTRALARIESQGDGVDRAAVAAAVTKAVASAFKPFEAAVVAAGAQDVVADLAAVRAVDFRPAIDVFGVDVLDVAGNQMTVDIWNHPDAPAIDPDFIWTEGILRHLLLSDYTGENLWFGGEKGTGKSETARQFAARTGRAFKRINFHKFTAAEEYIGAVGLQGGATVFEKRDFLQAYTCPSSVILLDEVTNADPGELAPLNGFLEPKAAVAYGGQVHVRAPGVLVFAADNTFGNGDDSGRYAGTRTQNSALVDRFARVIAFKFLPAEQEQRALVQHTGCTAGLAAHIHAAIVVARSKVETAEITDAPSIRSAMAFIRALRVLPPVEAWEAAVVARQPVESHATLRGIYAACINPETITNNL